jgi:hypothetical protein
MLRRTICLLFLLAPLAACTNDADVSPAPGPRDASNDVGADARFDADAESDASRDAFTDASACALEATSSLPGVAVRFAATDCTFTLAQAAAGISIPYTLTVDADIDVVNAADLPPLGAVDVGGLEVLEDLSGGGQHYCVCDTGLWPARDAGTSAVLKRGTYAHAFTWHGRNWNGPSDTSTPEGAPFPAGTYRFETRARGTYTGDAGVAPFTVTAAFRVTLVP